MEGDGIKNFKRVVGAGSVPSMRSEGGEKKICPSRESNPGQTDGNHLFYH